MITRLIKLLEIPKFLTWLWANKEKNDLDPKMLDYPTLRVAVTEKDGKSLVFIPFHTGWILDSVAFNPEADAKERLVSVLTTVQNIEQDALTNGVRELIYVSSDERLDESAIKNGWERLTVLRKRIGRS